MQVTHVSQIHNNPPLALAGVSYHFLLQRLRNSACKLCAYCSCVHHRYLRVSFEYAVNMGRSPLGSFPISMSVVAFRIRTCVRLCFLSSPFVAPQSSQLHGIFMFTLLAVVIICLVVCSFCLRFFVSFCSSYTRNRFSYRLSLLLPSLVFSLDVVFILCLVSSLTCSASWSGFRSS